MRLALAIAAFELRQQLRGHVFWIVVAVSALMVVGAVSSPALRVGLAETGAVSAADFAIRTHLVWSLFYLFTAAAFAADVVLRDELTGFGPIVRATPVPRRTHVLGRFLGAYAATALCYLTVPAGLQLAAGGPLAANLYGLALFGLPNLLIATALFLALASLARSMFGAMLGAVALLGLYGSGAEAGWSLAEPFGFAALTEATAGWSPAERASRIPPLAGPILLNRLLWIALSLAVLALLLKRPAVHPRPRPAGPVADDERERSATLSPGALPSPDHSSSARTVMVLARLRLELGHIVFTPVFAILLLLGLAHAGSVLWRMPATDPDALPVALAGAFQLTPIVVILFFAGELYWAERDRRVHDLIAATPVSNAALFLPKLLALSLALFGLACASGAAALLVPMFTDGAAPSSGRVFLAWILPKWFDWTLVGALALFLQSLGPNKLAGWGLFVLYLIASLTLELSGYTNPVYRYAEYPTYPIPEPLAGIRPSGFRAYWTAIALSLTLLALRLSGRGGHDGLLTRLRRLRAASPSSRAPGRAAA